MAIPVGLCPFPFPTLFRALPLLQLLGGGGVPASGSSDLLCEGCPMSGTHPPSGICVRGA